MFPLFSI